MLEEIHVFLNKKKVLFLRKKTLIFLQKMKIFFCPQMLSKALSGSPGLSRAHWNSSNLSGALWGSVGLSGALLRTKSPQLLKRVHVIDFNEEMVPRRPRRHPMSTRDPLLVLVLVGAVVVLVLVY